MMRIQAVRDLVVVLVSKTSTTTREATSYRRLATPCRILANLSLSHFRVGGVSLSSFLVVLGGSMACPMLGLGAADVEVRFVERSGQSVLTTLGKVDPGAVVDGRPVRSFPVYVD